MIVRGVGKQVGVSPVAQDPGAESCQMHPQLVHPSGART